MVDRWYYSCDGRTCGPVDGKKLLRLMSFGQLASSDLLWREGMADWATADSLGFGAGQVGAAPPPPPNTAVSPPPPLIVLPTRPTAVECAPARQPNKRALGRPGNSPWANRSVLLTIGWLMGVATALAIAAVVYVGSSWKTRGPGTNSQPPVARSAERAAQANAVSARDPDRPLVRANSPDPTAPNSASLPPSLPSPSARAAPSVGALTPRATLPLSPPPDSPADAAPPPSGSHDPDAHWLYQVVDIHRLPTFAIQGATIAQEIHYQVLSRLDLGAADADGQRRVTQYIEGTRLLAADDLSRAAFADSLEQIKQQQFLFTLNRFHEVIDFQGHQDNRQLIPLEMAANQGIMVTSVIDRDGWRELAELTFFQPDQQFAEGRAWKRPINHDWGPLGNWSGETTFHQESKASPLEIQQISFRHEIQYAPPQPKADEPPMAMGMRIIGAEFRPLQTGGAIQYNSRQQRVQAVQEVFSVQGALNVQLLGQPVRVELTERQVISIQLHEQNPWQE